MMGELTKKISACTFGALLAFTVVPAAVAHADQTDAEFTSFVESHGIHLGTPAQTVNMAHQMCQDLDAGYFQSDEIDQLTTAATQPLSKEQAQFFIAAATADYCPKYHQPKRPAG